MLSILSSSSLQDILSYTIVFVLGVFIKSKMNWGKTNNDVVNTLINDYRAIKELYNAKIDIVKRKDEQLLSQAKEILELRARIRSYENFIQSRPPEIEGILSHLKPVIEGLAEKLGVEYPKEKIDGHMAAHSQNKEYAVS